jgi:hypothetical protein
MPQFYQFDIGDGLHSYVRKEDYLELEKKNAELAETVKELEQRESFAKKEAWVALDRANKLEADMMNKIKAIIGREAK